MAQNPAKYINIRLVFDKSSVLLKTAVSAAIALCTLVLVTIRVNTWQAEDQIRRLKEQAAVLETENARLQQQVDGLGTVESIRAIAAEKLGLVDPDTIIFESE